MFFYTVILIVKIPINSFTKLYQTKERIFLGPGVYSREEAGFGIFPNISLRGVNTLRSAAITMMEDEVNIAPAPYSAPDAY